MKKQITIMLLLLALLFASQAMTEKTKIGCVIFGMLEKGTL